MGFHERILVYFLAERTSLKQYFNFWNLVLYEYNLIVCLRPHYWAFWGNSILITAYSERLEQYFIANSIGQCPADATQEVVGGCRQEKSRGIYFSYWKEIVRNPS
jgi:hypothetical protein